jgi:hypothetical protein
MLRANTRTIFLGEKRMRTGVDEHDTEDKKYWVSKYGIEKEKEFCKFMSEVVGISTIINPEKYKNIFVPDIIVNGALSDLKCIGTPFYLSGKLYKTNPQYAVTFDDKDYMRYKKNYPNINIYFWVQYEGARGSYAGATISLLPMDHIFEVSFNRLKNYIEANGVPHHTYKRRIDDEIGNSRGCYIFDVRSMKCLYNGTGVE